MKLAARPNTSGENECFERECSGKEDVEKNYMLVLCGKCMPYLPL